MPTSQEVDIFRQQFQDLLGRQPEPEAVSAFASSGTSLQNRIAEIQNSPERQQYLAQQQGQGQALQKTPKAVTEATYQPLQPGQRGYTAPEPYRPVETYQQPQQIQQQAQPLSDFSANLPSAQDLLGQFGFNVNPQAFQMQPVQSFQDTYQGLYQQMGLDTFKQNIDKSIEQLNQLNNERDQKIQNVNNNPWISEGLRVREVRQVTDLYDKKKANLTAALNLQQHQLDRGRQEAQFVAGHALQQFNADRTFNQHQLQLAIQTAEHQIEAQRKQYEFATTERRRGYEFGVTAGQHQQQFERQLAADQARVALQEAGLNIRQQSADTQAALAEARIARLEQLGTSRRKGGSSSGGNYVVSLNKSQRQTIDAAHINPQDAQAIRGFLNTPKKFQNLFITNLQPSIAYNPNQPYFGINEVTNNYNYWQATQGKGNLDSQIDKLIT